MNLRFYDCLILFMDNKINLVWTTSVSPHLIDVWEMLASVEIQKYCKDRTSAKLKLDFPFLIFWNRLAHPYTCSLLQTEVSVRITQNGKQRRFWWNEPSHLHLHCLLWYLLSVCSTEFLMNLQYVGIKAVLTSTHNLCFWAEIRKIMYIPVNPSFAI